MASLLLLIAKLFSLFSNVFLGFGYHMEIVVLDQCHSNSILSLSDYRWVMGLIKDAINCTVEPK